MCASLLLRNKFEYKIAIKLLIDSNSTQTQLVHSSRGTYLYVFRTNKVLYQTHILLAEILLIKTTTIRYMAVVTV